MASRKSFNIVVTDINHHVRNFLLRELEKEGYAVSSVKTGIMAYDRIFSPIPLDLIVLDPEIFHCFDQNLIEEIVRRHPSLHIIMHTYADSLSEIKPGHNIYSVEKDGQSIGLIKSIIRICFERYENNKGS